MNNDYKRRIIGLTGGIGTGKTTVSNYLASVYNLPILDADVYARDAVKVGSTILNLIVERYGLDILLPDGTLDRGRLGNVVFNNFGERRWLEQQIHPFVRDRIVEAIDNFNLHPTVVSVVPLLFEAGMTDLCTEVWVVSCSQQQQIQRLIQRDRLTFEQAQVRINSQMPIDQKCAKADVVLDNSSTLEFLLQQVDAAIKSFEC